MCFVPGSGWKRLDLEQYRISGLTFMKEMSLVNSMALGSGTNARGRFLVDTDRDEFGQTRTGLIEHTQGRVLRINQIGRCLGDAPQSVGEGLFGPDRHDRVEQAEQLFRAGELEAIWHPS